MLIDCYATAWLSSQVGYAVSWCSGGGKEQWTNYNILRCAFLLYYRYTHPQLTHPYVPQSRSQENFTSWARFVLPRARCQ